MMSICRQWQFSAGMAGNFLPEWVAVFAGINGRFEPEYASGIRIYILYSDSFCFVAVSTCP
jgi:hypothetical protein